MKLRIGLQRVENIVFGRVLEQDESLRGMRAIFTKENMVIEGLCSVGHPELDYNCLFIRGAEKDRDNDWFARAFDSADTAGRAVEDIRRLVAKVNETQPEIPLDNCGLEVIE